MKKYFNNMNEEEDYSRLKKASDLELGIGIEEDKLEGIDHRYYCTHNNPDVNREKYDDEWSPTPSPEPSGLGCNIDDFRQTIFSGMNLTNENDKEKEATGETTISPPPPTGLLTNTQISETTDTHHQTSSFGFGVSIINEQNKEQNYDNDNDQYQYQQDEEQDYDNDNDNDQYQDEQDEEQDYDYYNDQYQDEQDEEHYDDREDTDMHEYPNVIGSGQQQHINYSYQLMPNSIQSSVPNISIETNIRVPRTGIPFSDNDQDNDQVMQ